MHPSSRHGGGFTRDGLLCTGADLLKLLNYGLRAGQPRCVGPSARRPPCVSYLVSCNGAGPARVHADQSNTHPHSRSHSHSIHSTLTFTPLYTPARSYFTYSLTDDSMRLSETGAAFLEDLISKHAIHAGGAEEVGCGAAQRPQSGGRGAENTLFWGTTAHMYISCCWSTRTRLGQTHRTHPPLTHPGRVRRRVCHPPEIRLRIRGAARR
jgi:hypothetical protein